MNTMSHDELKDFVEKVGCVELYNELDELKFRSDVSSRFFEGVKTCLTALGYDRDFVHNDVSKALDEKYTR